MVLSVASSIATSALRAAQVGMSVTSANIASADVDGYTAKTVTLTSTVAGGQGTGVSAAAIAGGVNRFLYASYLSATSDQASADTTADFTDRLQALMGSTTGSDDDSGTSVATLITNLTTAASTLSTAPDSATAKAQIVEAADNVASSLRTVATGIAALASEADGTIATDVDTVNTALASIDKFNDAITSATARGQSTADLEDQRNSALKTVATYMNIRTTSRADGGVNVYTASGTALVNSAVHSLDYGNGTVTAGGIDVTSDVTSGDIGALLTLRGTTLSEARSELDNLSSTLASTVNGALADGAASPPTTSLTDANTVAASDAFSATGSVRVALVNADGTLSTFTDVDLSACATVNDVVSSLDAIDGIEASLDDDGKLVITAEDDDLGVAIGPLDSACGDDDQSFSAYFGLNALFTGTSAADIAVDADTAADPSRLATAKLDDSLTADSLTATDVTALKTGSSDIADALLDALTADTDFASAGRLGASSSTIADYAATVVADYADRASDAATDQTTKTALTSSLANSISSQSGVNLDEETARLNDYQTLYSAAAQVVQAAKAMFDTLLEMVN